MMGAAARRAGWLAWLVVLVLVTACGRSSEPGADQPRSATTTAAGVAPAGLRVQEYPVPAGSRPHDVAPAADGRSVWYTAQGSGQLGLLDPATGESRLIPLGEGSAPHGVIVGPDGAPWVTDGGLNAIVRVDPGTEKVDRYPLPPERGSANLNTAVFRGGVLWFTGQAGVLGRLDPKVGRVEVFDARRGPGPTLQGPYVQSRPPDGARARCVTMVRATPADPWSEPGSLLMTRSIPRLLGYATVGAGVAAAGYVGLSPAPARSTSASAGGSGHSAPSWSTWPPHARWSSTSSPSRIWVGLHGRWPTSSGCWTAAATWSWQPT
jgi:hypothetical protein